MADLSTLTTDIGEKTFTVGQATEFTFTTKANDDAGIMVVGTSNFSDPGAIRNWNTMNRATVSGTNSAERFSVLLK